MAMAGHGAGPGIVKWTNSVAQQAGLADVHGCRRRDVKLPARSHPPMQQAVK
jgi:hypothetical protein